jgi:hypothetical protein
MGTYQTFSDYVRERVGANWVLARRTPRIIQSYGADVACLTKQQYGKLQEDYRRTSLRTTDGEPDYRRRYLSHTFHKHLGIG